MKKLKTISDLLLILFFMSIFLLIIISFVIPDNEQSALFYSISIVLSIGILVFKLILDTITYTKSPIVKVKAKVIDIGSRGSYSSNYAVFLTTNGKKIHLNISSKEFRLLIKNQVLKKGYLVLLTYRDEYTESIKILNEIQKQ
ncbi:MAG: hypothetical protein FWF57_08535 [Defluviitaleaceae bacterium]|nr:hypothetical protein [Defluviitaleaceae bacterium]